MIKPKYYLQGDAKWANHNYSAKGESKTIRSSGCGPTSAAMLIETLRPDISGTVTPVTTADWSMAHGYKALNQGTFYTYFKPQFAAYNITCKQMNNANKYHKNEPKLENEAKKLLTDGGYFLICCMGPGNWTSGGHYIVAYHVDSNNQVYINDPASKAAGRLKAPWATFVNQVKYFWSVKWGIKYTIKGTDKSYKLYKSHDSTSKKLESLKSGSAVWVIRDMKDGWSLVATKDNIGYAKNSIINAVGLSAYKRMTLTSDSIPVHEKNSGVSPVLLKLIKNSEVKIVTKRKKWTNIICPDKTSGWILTKYIEK